MRNHGVSLVEMVVVTAILSIVVLTSSTLIYQFIRAQNMISSRDETNEFSSALTRHFQIEAQCRTSLVGRRLMANFTPISINNFSAYNSDVSTGPVQAGYQVTNTSRVKLLNIRHKPGAPFDPVSTGSATTSFRTVAQFELELEMTEGSGTEEKVTALPRRYFEIPVNVSTGTLPANVVNCAGAVDMRTACIAAGGAWQGSPSTGTCNTSAVGGIKCRTMGYYTNYTQSDPGYPSMASPGQVNPLTGSRSCPNPSTAVVTGGRDWQQDYDCGKKCTVTVYYSEVYYMCMAC